MSTFAVGHVLYYEQKGHEKVNICAYSSSKKQERIMISQIEVLRVKEPDDPCRCQASTPRGQCFNKAVEGTQFCIAHSAYKSLAKNEQKRLNMYRLTKFRARMDELNEEQPKNLREEIAILRIMIEEFMKKIQDETDGILLYSGRAADLISRLEKVVKTCHTIDIDTGRMLDKNQALQFAEQVTELISESIESVIKELGEDTNIQFSGETFNYLTNILRHKLVDVLIGRIVEQLATINGRANS